MRAASSTYKMVKALDNSWIEWRVLQNENVYGLDLLKSITVSYALTSGSGISIGNANSAECRMTLIEESANWERMARFTVQFRVCLGSSGTKSEWITLGAFYTDERSEDKQGNLSIIAFDGMLKMEQSWTDKIPDELLPASFPITAKAWATMIQSAGLATFADLTQLDDTVAFVGLNTTSTIRDVLKSIAAVHGGNWVMTASETLKLIPFENVTQSQTSKYTKLGLSIHEFEDSPALSAVTGVHLETDAGTVMEAGDETGYVVKSIVDTSSTAGIADLCLDHLEDYVFIPFEAHTAYLDPIVEIGDSAQIDGKIYQIMSIDWTLAKTPTADVSAPYDNEIDHEYTVASPEAKSYRKTVSIVDEKMGDYVPWTEMHTAIEQNETQITLIAESTCVKQTEYDAQIAEIQNQLDGSIQTWSGNAVPTLNNSPAVDWNTAALKAEHVGDTYFVNSDAGIPEAGSYYRFENNNGVYSWQLLTDSALTEALAQAAAAQAAAETAQNTANASMTEAQAKGRIFVVPPEPPYDVGDLWFNNTSSVIKVCMTARAADEPYDLTTDWVKRDNYTDEATFNQFLASYQTTINAIQSQVDQKAETYYQSGDPAAEWGGCIAGIAIAGIDVIGISSLIGNAHVGDLWYRTTDNTTWFWNGTEWVQQDVPDEVFDMIDGKAQIFVSQPTTDQEYNIGDLWVNATYGNLYSNDVLRSGANKAAGEPFNINHWAKASKYTDDSAFQSFVDAVYTPEIAAIQTNLDGKVDTYFYNYAPTLSNAPANTWTTTAVKDSHVDDLFYNTTTGYTYRFTKSGSAYSWSRIKDSDITTAMSTASTAKDTADGKRRVFVSQPTNADAYDIGDLWVNAIYGTTYSNDLLKCKMAKAAGASFAISHWEKASKYTDDSALTSFVNTVYNPEVAAIQENLDGKIDTYFYNYVPTLSNAPASSWNTTAKKDAHVNDLFYNTSTGYTYKFTNSGSTYSWNRIKDSDITTAMSTASTAKDTADGKRRVFVNQPTPPYDVGDLWVNATYGSTYSNDLLKCKTAKASGSFSIANWEKASKYTDDSALDSFRITYAADLTVQNDKISAKVSKTSPTGQTSFSWAMNDSSHSWSANGNEVMKVNSSGLTVKGNITATSGYIGGNTGFTINATSIYNGMTSLSDTTHDGVYVGTNGIALGKGKFKVTSAGAITATSGKIGGFNITSSSLYNGMTSFNDETHNGVYIGTDGIALGKGSFRVTTDGSLYANNGYFLGLVQAASIRSAYTDPDTPSFGYFDGGGLTEYSVSGGYGGQIGYTNNGGLIGANMEYATISDAYTDNGINTSLGYANYAAGVFSGIQRANYLMASYVSASDQLIVGGYDVVWQYSSTLGGYVLMRSTA